MSLNLNQVTLAGHLTRDPAMRTLPSGSQVAEFGLALNDRYTDKSGQQVEQPCFVEIVAWAKSAEIAHTYLRKGDKLLLEGVLTYQAWQTENGDKRNRLRVTARRIHLLGRRSGSAGAEPPATEAETAIEPVAVAGEADNMPF